MQVVNSTNDKLVSGNLTKAISFRDKTFGLIFKSKNQAMLFNTRFGIHTFFMSHPLDVLILDSQNRVVKLKEDLKPFRFYFYPPIFYQILELPAGSIKKGKVTLGDKIKILH